MCSIRRMNDLLCNTCNTQCYVSTVLMHNYLLKETLLCKSIRKSETSGPAIRQEIPRLTSIIIPYIKIKSNKNHTRLCNNFIPDIATILYPILHLFILGNLFTPMLPTGSITRYPDFSPKLKKTYFGANFVIFFSWMIWIKREPPAGL